MLDILSIIPSKKRKTPSGWVTFNAVCCAHRGHKPDSRSRGGIRYEGPNSWVYSCFNCNYRCGWTEGQLFTLKTKQLLIWCGVDETQIQKWNLESIKNRDILDFTPVKLRKYVSFDTVELPEDAVLIDPECPLHSRGIKYLADRGFKYDSYPFMLTPTATGRNSDRIIIPYTHNNRIVGYTSRYLDGKTPKYINIQQPGYVFGIDLQKKTNEYVIVVEGVFDAIAIGGIGLLHNTISREQLDQINSLYKKVIVVPDRDRSGLELCDYALEYGLSVSLPKWHSEIKDVNDAVLKYGLVGTLLSIIQSATSSKIIVEIQRKKINAR